MVLRTQGTISCSTRPWSVPVGTFSQWSDRLIDPRGVAARTADRRPSDPAPETGGRAMQFGLFRLQEAQRSSKQFGDRC